jgi:hypothetical protein
MMNRHKSFLLLLSITAAISFNSAHSAPTLYAVQDWSLNDSQFFFSDPIGTPFAAFSPIYYDCDIEALDILPQTDELFAAAGDDTERNSHLYKVDKPSGTLFDLGDLGGRERIDEVDAISFHPKTGNLWGWSQCEGLFIVDRQLIPPDGLPIKRCEKAPEVPPIEAELVFQYPGEIEDIEWNDDGSVLYAVENMHPKPCAQIYPPAPNAARDPEVDIHGDDESLWPGASFNYDFHDEIRLWAYSTVTGAVQQICQKNLVPTIVKMFDNPAEIEGLEVLPRTEPGMDTLVAGFHGPKEVRYLGITIPIALPANGECDVFWLDKSIESPNDIEGLAYSPKDKP